MKQLPGYLMASLGLVLLVTTSFMWFGRNDVKETKTCTVGMYQNLSVSGSMVVDIKKGALGPVEATGIKLDNLITEVKNGTLYISCDGNCKDVFIKLQVPDLEKISLAGSGVIQCNDALGGTGNLAMDVAGSGKINTVVGSGNTKAVVAGSGHIVCKGETQYTEVQIAGSGFFDGMALTSPNSVVQIAGSGKADVQASEKCRVSIAGSGVVDVYGKPADMEKDIEGSGRVRVH